MRVAILAGSEEPTLPCLIWDDSCPLSARIALISLSGMTRRVLVRNPWACRPTLGVPKLPGWVPAVGQPGEGDA